MVSYIFYFATEPERIYLLGHQSNPFSLINKADLFVLSSHYEGQGLALLEAVALGKMFYLLI
ncbi:glycosyltransferase [Staphylococcus cohnii]|uniref:glycosyltransferase n=1 Tax=Staphylococcus cohnii TaxID=29382 RepID=UPI003CF66C9C